MDSACGNVASSEGFIFAMKVRTLPTIANIAIINISGVSPGG
jgi:hypothetical protein